MQTNTCLKNKIKWDSSACSKRRITHGRFGLAFQNEDAIHSMSPGIDTFMNQHMLCHNLKCKIKISKYQVQLIGWLWSEPAPNKPAHAGWMMCGQEILVHCIRVLQATTMVKPSTCIQYLLTSKLVSSLPTQLPRQESFTFPNYLPLVVTYYVLTKVVNQVE